MIDTWKQAMKVSRWHLEKFVHVFIGDTNLTHDFSNMIFQTRDSVADSVVGTHLNQMPFLRQRVKKYLWVDVDYNFFFTVAGKFVIFIKLSMNSL